MREEGGHELGERRHPVGRESLVQDLTALGHAVCGCDELAKGAAGSECDWIIRCAARARRRETCGDLDEPAGLDRGDSGRQPHVQA